MSWQSSSFRRSGNAAFIAACVLVAVIVAPLTTHVWAAPLVLPGAATNTTVNMDFLCGTHTAGNLSVTYSNEVVSFGGPFTDGTNWSVLGGMTITATATPAAPFDGAHFAWMQAVTTYAAPAIFQDAAGMALAAPFPDTPPGGYRTGDIFGSAPPAPPAPVNQPFDNDPWYANNQIGNLTLFDQPQNGAAASVHFESWLVCVVDVTAAFDVIPLMGFTWGFDFDRTMDMNGDMIVGNQLNEYDGTTSFGGLMQGGQPSAAFKAGYAKYFNMNYLENNDANCALCIPEPASVTLYAIAAVGLVGYRWRRRATARSARTSA